MTNIQHDEVVLPMPPGWRDASQIIAVAPVDGGFSPNVVVSREPAAPGETAKRYAARQAPLLARALPGLSVVGEGEARFGKTKGFSREQSFVGPNGRKLLQLQFYLVAGGMAYVFTFTHLAEKFEAVRPVAEKLFGGIAVRGAKK